MLHTVCTGLVPCAACGMQDWDRIHSACRAQGWSSMCTASGACARLALCAGSSTCGQSVVESDQQTGPMSFMWPLDLNEFNIPAVR